MIARKHNLPYFVAVGISALGIVLMYALSPLLGDDFWYLMTSSGSSGYDAMLKVWDEAWRHWHFDTGRLANLINAPFLTIVPKWAFGVACGFAVCLTFAVGRQIISASRCSLRAYLLIVGIVFALPWTDYMFSVVFSLNYLWTSTLVLLSLWFVLKADAGATYSRRQMWAVAVLCLLSGWMHEGFSVPVIGGLVSYWVVMRRLPGRQASLLFGFFMLGALLIVVAPAFWTRSAHAGSSLARFAGWEALASALLFNCVYYAFIVVAVVSFLIPSVRRRIVSQRRNVALIAFVLVSTTISTAIFFLYYNGSRMGWFGQLFGGMGLLYCCSFYRFRLHRLWRRIFVAMVFAGLGVHFVTAIMMQLRLTTEFNEIVRLYAGSSTGVVYYDNIRPRIDAGLWKPSFRQFNEKYPIQEFSYYYGSHKPDLVLLPTVLSHVDRSEAVHTADTAFIVFRNHILLTDTVAAETIKRIELKPRGGEWMESRCRTVAFTDSCGLPYTWIVPHIMSVNPSMIIADVRMPQPKK